MQHQQLSDFVAATAAEFGIPGVSVGVLSEAGEFFAAHGVTNLVNPQPVDERTVFPVASVTKTFTATALMRLAGEGKVDLDAPVRRYLPELRLADEQTAAQITVANLLNHTAGLDWNLIDTDEHDESLARFVANMADLSLISAPGARASYSQAGYNLAGRIIEKVTGLPFERAMAALILEPVGLSDTSFELDDIMVRRFAVGHNRDAAGVLRVARPWRACRASAHGNNPGGGIASSAADLLRWAKFHLGTGDGFVPAAALSAMQSSTVELRASTLGDAFGICWFLRDVAGVRTIGHGGSGNGQFAELIIVPERNFAVVSLANAGPDGYRFNQTVVRWALEHYLGVIDSDPKPVRHTAAQAGEVVGRYEIDVMNLDIAGDENRLTLEVGIKPEIRAASDADMPPDYEPAEIGFLCGAGDEYIVAEGGLKGQLGYFSRAEDGTIVGIDLAGRLFTRATESAEQHR